MRFSPYRSRTGSDHEDYDCVSTTSADCLSLKSDDETPHDSDGGDDDKDKEHASDEDNKVEVVEDEDVDGSVISFDSEDEAYPVSASPPKCSALSQRMEYDKQTQRAVRDGLLYKAQRLYRGTSTTYNRTKRNSIIDVIALDDMQSIEDLLARHAKSEDEDLAASRAFQNETQSLLQAIESTIAVAEAKEADRKAKEVAAKAEADRRAAETAARQRQEAEARAEAARIAKEA